MARFSRLAADRAAADHRATTSHQKFEEIRTFGDPGFALHCQECHWRVEVDVNPVQRVYGPTGPATLRGPTPTQVVVDEMFPPSDWAAEEQRAIDSILRAAGQRPARRVPAKSRVRPEE